MKLRREPRICRDRSKKRNGKGRQWHPNCIEAERRHH
uniref:Uncharacterized protein n=1 Tax=Anguilla anguilla TaxID=7936 RepID=A0A0E9VDI9_ANGAN